MPDTPELPPPDPDADGLLRLPEGPQPSQSKDDALNAIDAAATAIDAPYEEVKP